MYNFTNQQMNSPEELEKASRILQRCSDIVLSSDSLDDTPLSGLFKLEYIPGFYLITQAGFTQARISSDESGVFISFFGIESLDEISALLSVM